MVLVKKWAFFQLLFLSSIGEENVFYDIVKQKKSLSKLLKLEVEKVEKLTFFQRD